MLQKLIISNYALIDSLELDFSEHLTVITGETGSGKSIMLGALSMLQGARADTKVMADRERKTVIEGHFSHLPATVWEAVDAILGDDIPSEEEEGQRLLILRREMMPGGRSRAYINDTPVTLTRLQEIGERMLDIHSQHNNISLSSEAVQLQLIDALADNAPLLGRYQDLFRRYASLRTEIRGIKERMAMDRTAFLMIEQQLLELDTLDPKPGEWVEVQRQYDMLSDADEIRASLGGAVSLIEGGGEGEILTSVAQVTQAVEGIDLALFPEAEDVPKRLKEIYIELKDIAQTLQRCASDIDFSPRRLQEVSARMSALMDARRKYHVREDDGLVELRQDLRAKHAKYNASPETLNRLESEAREAAKVLQEMAVELTARRREAAEAFSSRLEAMAQPLGLKNLRFKAVVEPGKLGRTGADTVRFECAFNKNQPLYPMTKVASGGEISRLMLCIKSIMAGKMDWPTVIFDEIDTGVSGEIADKMGEMMHDMAEALQVMVITHLPQVAAKGEVHLKVYKRDDEHRTLSDVRVLSREGRITEIAGMISGRELNAAALDAARSLLGY